jgi:hypothetical protein
MNPLSNEQKSAFHPAGWLKPLLLTAVLALTRQAAAETAGHAHPHAIEEPPAKTIDHSRMDHGSMDHGSMDHGSGDSAREGRDPDAYSNGYRLDSGPYLLEGRQHSHMADSHRFSVLRIDRLERADGRDHTGTAYDAQAWWGGSYDRLWLKAEGEHSSGTLQEARSDTEYTCPMHPEIRSRPRYLPEMRHDARAGDAGLDEGGQSRARRFAPPLLVDAAADGDRHRDRHVRRRVRSDAGCARPWVELAAGDAGRALWAGWPFFVRCAQSIGNRSPNMWTLIGLGWGGLSATASSHGCARAVSGLVPHARPRGGVFRGGSGDHLADAARPGAGAEGALGDLGRDQGAARPGAEDRAPHSRGRHRRGYPADPRPPATGCACVRAKRCRSMAKCSKGARARSTNRC